MLPGPALNSWTWEILLPQPPVARTTGAHPGILAALITYSTLSPPPDCSLCSVTLSAPASILHLAEFHLEHSHVCLKQEMGTWEELLNDQGPRFHPGWLCLEFLWLTIGQTPFIFYSISGTMLLTSEWYIVPDSRNPQSRRDKWQVKRWNDKVYKVHSFHGNTEQEAPRLLSFSGAVRKYLPKDQGLLTLSLRGESA
jgi:hypothetical protein